MEYPLAVNFKKVALAQQFSMKDANQNMVFYVKQKMFKLKEEIKVCSDREQNNLLYTIKADRIIDFSAKYTFYDSTGTDVGSVKRQGRKSIWRAHYEIEDNENEMFTIKEDSAFIRFIDAYLGFITSMFINPTYTVTRQDGTPVLKIKKQPALMEGKFSIEKLGEMNPKEEKSILLGAVMMLLLERMRG